MKQLLLVIFFFSFNGAVGQLLDSTALDSVRIYSSIEEALKNPDAVYKLELKRERYKEFPKEILQFKNLNVLVISHNKLDSLPQQLAELQYLQHLNIDKNRFEKLPDVICELKSLKHLVVSRNDIDSIPDNIDNLSELKVLDAWSTNLGYFPATLGNLKHLEVLELQGINMTLKEQQDLIGLLPGVEVNMSNSCGCGG